MSLSLWLLTNGTASGVFSSFMTDACMLPKLNPSVTVSIYGVANGPLEQAAVCIYITE